MIAILGHTNTENGLSEIAKSRCDRAFEIWKTDVDQEVIVTGTFGKHFNTTPKSHFVLLKEYLLELGIPNEKMVGIYSSNTYEDILGIRKICIDKGVTHITIVTSDFHANRTTFLCNRLLQNIGYEIVEVETASGKELEKLRKQEKKSIKVAKNEVFDFPLYNSPNDNFPKEVYENANNEHKHYDNISIVSVTGQFVIFGFGINFLNNLMVDINSIAELRSSIPIVLAVAGFVFLLWKLYRRTAKTAIVARKLLRSIEISYGYYGFSTLFQKQRFSREFFGTMRIVNFAFSLQIFVIVFMTVHKMLGLC
ncbi:MAG: YdcF family protein [Allomuricauda sp.]